MSEIRRTTGFVVETSRGPLESPVLVVACGGLSIPKMGATSLGYDIARQFGIKIAATRPALVPFTWSPEDLTVWGDLGGVATETVASFGSQCFPREDAVHASWTERTRDLADFFVLATWPADTPEPAAGHWCG